MSEKRVSSLLLFFIFLKIGAFTWGGGYAMLPLIRREIVERQRLLTEEEFLEALALAQSLPGAVAVNTASFVGLALGGTKTQLLAVFATALPSFLAIALIAPLFLRFRQLAPVASFFRGALAVVVSLVVLAIWQVGKGMTRNVLDLSIAVCLFVLLVFTGIHPLFVVLLGGGLGILLKR